MPTTDNMRKTITKTNFVYTFTTAFPGVYFENHTLISSATSGTFTGVRYNVQITGVGGAVIGGEFMAYSNVATPGSAHVYGIYVDAGVLSGKYTASGYIWGAYVRVGSESDSVITGGVIGLYIDNSIQCAVTGSHYMVYYRNNSTIDPDAYTMYYGGADYFIEMAAGGHGGASGTVGNVTAGGERGWLKVNNEGADRYIQLYYGPPA